MNRVRRRHFLIVAGGLLLAPLVAINRSIAQGQGDVPRVAVLLIGSLDSQSKLVAAFRERLGALGYVEGRNVTLEIREADSRLDQLPRLIEEILLKNPKVIVVTGSLGVKVAMAATSTIAIVATTVGEPVEQGFAVSLARPGKNVTGNALIQEVSDQKTVEILHELVPKASSIAVLSNPKNPLNPRVRKRFEAAGKKRGLNPIFVQAALLEEVPKAFAEAVAQRADALIVANDGLYNANSKMIVDLAARHRIPTIYPGDAHVVNGGLMSYAYSASGMFSNAAVFVDRILKGQKPAELAFEQPTNFELVINRKTAKALGLKIPQSLLLRADRMIE